MVSWHFAGGLTGNGYSREPVTQRRPLPSKAILMGLSMSGSEATSWISKPGGRWKVFCSSRGVRAGVVRMFSAKGSAPKTQIGSASESSPDANRSLRFMKLPLRASDVEKINENPPPTDGAHALGFTGDKQGVLRSWRWKLRLFYATWLSCGKLLLAHLAFRRS